MTVFNNWLAASLKIQYLALMSLYKLAPAASELVVRGSVFRACNHRQLAFVFSSRHDNWTVLRTGSVSSWRTGAHSPGNCISPHRFRPRWPFPSLALGCLSFLCISTSPHFRTDCLGKAWECTYGFVASHSRPNPCQVLPRLCRWPGGEEQPWEEPAAPGPQPRGLG